jgi:AcrR family transcriptional regulator
MSATLQVLGPEVAGKRERMLEAARSLFLAHGYGAVSMDAVARAAGVSKATLYAHFESKDRLFATIIATTCSRKWEFLESLSDEGGLRQALIDIASACLGLMLREDSLAVYRMTIAESARFPELGRAFYENGPQAFRERLATWIAKRAALGWLDVPDVGTAADQFMGMLRGNLHMRASLGLLPASTEAVIDQAAADATDTFLRAFDASGGRPATPAPLTVADV